MNLFDSSIEVINYDSEHIDLYFKLDNQIITIDFTSMKVNKAKEIYKCEMSDRVILKYYPTSQHIFFLYVFKNTAYAILENIGIRPKTSKEDYYPYEIENYYDAVTLKQFGCSRVGITNDENNVIFYIEDFLTREQTKYNVSYDMGFSTTEFRYTVVSIATYDRYNIVVIYDLFKKEFQVNKFLITILKQHKEINIKLTSQNAIEISNKYSIKEVNFSALNNGKRYRLFSDSEVKGADKLNILTVITINRARYYIYTSAKSIYIARGNPERVTGHQSSLKVLMTKRHVIFAGRLTHYAHKANGRYEHLYLQSSNNKVGRFIRPFKSIPLLKRYGFFRVPFESFFINDRIHNNLFVGDEEILVHNLKRKPRDAIAKTINFKKFKDQLLVMRTNLQGNITATIIPFSPEYSLMNRIKINVAQFSSKFFKNSQKNVNLFFEKKSEKADESGFRVFEEVMANKSNISDNYFIINAKTERYLELREKYGSNIIKKYSFKHYLSIFRANYFISSELSNHLLNDRLYIDNIRSKLMSVPLVFLQHGIMFAKPVDNPMAFGFHKDKNLYNMYKSVISSELESKEFHKMGYADQDLILTGLATLDYAKLDENADKIAYMPTYRYWEEGLIYNNDIEKTSYYKAIMKVIGAFSDAGLIDRLLIVPHNKFSQFIYENMPKYKHIIENNPSEALKKSIVFITDYSSAIYDAIFRGAYPIFYWEEKEYLIENYKAIPPVNEENAPGPVASDTIELVHFVKEAIKRDYELEDIYKERYLKINKFNDRKNTQRIVQFLKDDQII